MDGGNRHQEVVLRASRRAQEVILAYCTTLIDVVEAVSKMQAGSRAYAREKFIKVQESLTKLEKDIFGLESAKNVYDVEINVNPLREAITSITEGTANLEELCDSLRNEANHLTQAVRSENARRSMYLINQKL